MRAVGYRASLDRLSIYVDDRPRFVIPRLPPLTVGTASWSLPLADHTVWELSRILLLDSTNELTAAAADLMSVDPAFALWSACSAGLGSAGLGSTGSGSTGSGSTGLGSTGLGSTGSGSTGSGSTGSGSTGVGTAMVPRCVVDLSNWFAAHALRVLSWPSDAWSEAGPGSERDIRPRWRELTADGMAVASLAADLADDDTVAAEAFLFGLLHNAADWLRSCGPKVSPSRDQGGCLPGWLVALLAERARGPRSEPVGLVMRGGTLWREAGRRGATVAGVDLSEVRAVRKRWRSAAQSSINHSMLLPNLARKLRRLSGLEQRFSQVLETEKLEALGELAYGASHEINNPLANISARAQSMLRDEADPERRRTLAVINTQAFRANEMIADMMLFARPPEPVLDRINLVAVVDDVIGELTEESQQQGTQLRRNGDSKDEVYLWIDGTQIAVALRAICLNGLESLSTGGQVEVEVEGSVTLSGEPGEWARISICDTGPGISPEVRRHLFDPFFSGREAGRGLGLGLSKCWRVVSLHRGRIDVSSQLGKGATFTILLPAGEPATVEGEVCK